MVVINAGTSSKTLGDQAYLTTADESKREVRVKNEKHVNVENLEGEWEIYGGAKWHSISSLSLVPIDQKNE